MARPFVLVVQGGPATGKTTLCRKLSKDLQLGLLAKDDFKEQLYDVAGAPLDREDSRVYGTAAMEALYAMADVFLGAGKSFIFESAFRTEFADNDFAALQKRHDVRLVQLFCTASPETRLERYKQRIRTGDRHPAHPDHLDKTLDDFLRYDTQYKLLAINDTLKIDTDSFGDAEYEVVLGKLKKMMEGDKNEATN